MVSGIVTPYCCGNIVLGISLTQSVKVCGYAFNMSSFDHAMCSIIMRWSCQVFLFFSPSKSKVIGILGESEVEHRDYIDLVLIGLYALQR